MTIPDSNTIYPHTEEWQKEQIEVKVMVRPLNKGETFCCSMKEVKNVFQNTEVELNFAYYGRNYSTFAETPDGYYLKNHIKGYVIAASYMEARRKDIILSFYVLKEERFTSAMKKEFSEKYLPEFYRLYTEMQSYSEMQDVKKLILVEYLDGKLILHKTRV